MSKLTPKDQYIINEIRSVLKNRTGSIEEFRGLETKMVSLSEKAQKFLQSKNQEAVDVREEAFVFLLQLLRHLKRDGVFEDRFDKGEKVKARIGEYMYANEFLRGRFDIDKSFDHRVDFRQVQNEIVPFLDWVKSESGSEEDVVVEKDIKRANREGMDSQKPRSWSF
ncbi:MAG: hypothetical protein COU28_01985 [Candidatus Magasanikbacteria bacterium CG10_big_fil_rev_8_21_14_0_10_36_16]|uniref:Uncharacterized protein n=1 Tax=Candidatus Magasanikbacteria bacterium CG10_big_fil_rev_8_21_14_0_10_36_16 TaxID=1974645 RepID=A0A2H0TYS4_9BACT|nr:MAG: hypothetical protein COU28_01985 [Candidatus Magasanikbacteria bacterium CG10_big_fil_rev_8_21_14_0_10_36_16]